MINEKYAKLYCKDDISEIYGYKEAIADEHNMWACHHCLGLIYTKEELIEKGLYYNQPAEMLMFVIKSHHQKLHFITNNRKVGGGVTWNKGKTGVYSKETLEKMKESHIGKKHTKEAIEKNRYLHINHPKLSKKVGQYSLDGVLICEYQSLSEAARQIGVGVSNISLVCSGKRKQCKGFIFAYI